jgi:hypothetical protein
VVHGTNGNQTGRITTGIGEAGALLHAAAEQGDFRWLFAYDRQSEGRADRDRCAENCVS